MNRHAFIDGYTYKTAMGAEEDPKKRMLELARRGENKSSGYFHHLFQGNPPETFNDDPFFKKDWVKKGLKDNKEFSWLLNPYKAEPISFTHRIIGPSIYYDEAAKAEKQLKADAAKQDWTRIKQYYTKNPRVRKMAQKMAIPKIIAERNNKIKEYAGKAMPWIAGGAGLIFLMTAMFRKKKQGATPQQLAMMQRQIRQMQAQRMQQRPMRLNLVGRA